MPAGPPSLVLFGVAGGFTRAVLARLLDGGVVPRALVLPAGAATGLAVAPALGPLEDLVRDAGIPVGAMAGSRDPDLAARLAALAPEHLLVACFPRLLPEAVTAAARRAALNIHPSLLPRYRGPAPLFWQFRAGDRDFGVTLHRVEPALDAGPVLVQARVELADGISGAEADARLAARGAELFLEHCVADRSAPGDYYPQGPGGSRQGWPGAEDFRLSSHWDARRAYNFLRAVEHMTPALVVETPDGEVMVRGARRWYRPGCSPAPPGPRARVVPFTGGALELELAD